MSEISGEVFIRGATINAERELHVKDGAHLVECIIYCDALVQWPPGKVDGCVVYSRLGVGACYDKITRELIQEVNDIIYKEECRELDERLVKRIVQHVISSMKEKEND